MTFLFDLASSPAQDSIPSAVNASATAELGGSQLPEITTGQMPGNQTVKFLSGAMLRIKQSQALAVEIESSNERLANQIADAIKIAGVSKEALAILNKWGVLQVEVQFKNCNERRQTPNKPFWISEDRDAYRTHQISLQSFDEVPSSLSTSIKEGVEKYLAPKYCELLYREFPNKKILDRMFIVISDCRQVMHLNEFGVLTECELINGSKAHQLKVTNGQDLLHYAEKAFQSAANVCSKKVQEAIESIFGKSHDAPMCILENELENRKLENVKKVWIRLVFNQPSYTDSIPCSEAKYYTKNITPITSLDIAHLFQKLKSQEYFGKDPICKFGTLVTNQNGEKSYQFNPKGELPKNSYAYVVADYALDLIETP